MKNWCTQKWEEGKSKLFRRTETHKIARNRYNEKEHCFIFFGMCLAVVCFTLLLAGVASAAPAFYDDFSDGKFMDRTGTDPWGRSLPEWRVALGAVTDFDASNGRLLMTKKEGRCQLEADFHAPGDEYFKLSFDYRTLVPETTQDYLKVDIYNSEGDRFEWGRKNDGHHWYTLKFADGSTIGLLGVSRAPYIPYASGGDSQDGTQWTHLDIERHPDHKMYILVDGLRLGGAWAYPTGVPVGLEWEQAQYGNIELWDNPRLYHDFHEGYGEDGADYPDVTLEGEITKIRIEWAHWDHEAEQYAIDNIVFDSLEDNIPPYTSGHSPAKDATDVSKDTDITVHIIDEGEGIDQSSIVMTVEETPVIPTITGTANDYTVTYTPSTPFDYGQVVGITIEALDLAGNVMPPDSYSFIADTKPTADFSAAPTSGLEPLTVTFSDNSASYDGIIGWNWDFNNDGVTDSTEQNPTHVYAEDGIYTMSLTVTESDGGSDTMTKTDYITVTKVNNAPYVPDNPSPSDGATDVPIEEALSWTGDDPDDGDTVTYNVYFGTSMTPPLVAESQLGTTYDPGTFDHSTEYYWRIVAMDNHGALTGSEVWGFVTDAAPDPDLVAEWDLDEGSGVTAVDSSGNGNDGTLVNNPAWVNGKVGNGLSFDGINDHVDCGRDTSLKITGAITVEAWVKWSGDGNHYFVTKFGGPGYRSYDLSGNSDGTVEFRVGGSDCNIIKSSGPAPIPTGEWVYLVGTYEPSTYVRLFVNGVLTKENTASIPASQGDNGLAWYIGAREGNQGWFNGIIDEVKIHNGALSAEKIRANYEAYS